MNVSVPFAGATQRRATLLFACLIPCVFLFGGGSSSGVDSLLFLRPFAAALLVFALFSLRGEDARLYRGPLTMLGMAVLLTLLHLVPLPPGLWSALPGHELVDRMQAHAGVAGQWRPLALVPHATWNALFSLLVPGAVLLVMVQLPAAYRVRVLDWILLFALASSVIALLQLVTQASFLYFFEVTNLRQAVGLFANRNHQALLLVCALPMLAFFAAAPGRPDEVRVFRGWIGATGVLFLFPLILVTGSRAGLVLALPAAVFAALLYETSLPQTAAYRAGRRRRLTYYAGVVLLLASLAGLFLTFSRAEAVSRIYDFFSDPDNERWPYWQLMPGIIWTYFPFGSGIGSFPEVFQIHEPVALLKPTYFNHAHNDLLEVALVAGLPGVLLVVSGVAAFLFGVVRLLRPMGVPPERLSLARLGAMTIFLLSLASLVDYPLRTPSLAAIFVIAVIWMSQGQIIGARGGENSAESVS